MAWFTCPRFVSSVSAISLVVFTEPSGGALYSKVLPRLDCQTLCFLARDGRFARRAARYSSDLRHIFVRSSSVFVSQRWRSPATIEVPSLNVRRYASSLASTSDSPTTRTGRPLVDNTSSPTSTSPLATHPPGVGRLAHSGNSLPPATAPPNSTARSRR